MKSVLSLALLIHRSWCNGCASAAFWRPLRPAEPAIRCHVMHNPDMSLRP